MEAFPAIAPLLFARRHVVRSPSLLGSPHFGHLIAPRPAATQAVARALRNSRTDWPSRWNTKRVSTPSTVRICFPRPAPRHCRKFPEPPACRSGRLTLPSTDLHGIHEWIVLLLRARLAFPAILGECRPAPWRSPVSGSSRDAEL